jgi:hypothetical protein
MKVARIGVVAGVLAVLSTPASGKAPEKDAKKEHAHLRYAHSWAEAIAEAKDRGCVVFATFHADG